MYIKLGSVCPVVGKGFIGDPPLPPIPEDPQDQTPEQKYIHSPPFKEITDDPAGYRELKTLMEGCPAYNKETAMCGETNEACIGIDVVTLPLTPLRSYLIALVTLAKEAKFNHLAEDAQETLNEIERLLGGEGK